MVSTQNSGSFASLSLRVHANGSLQLDRPFFAESVFSGAAAIDLSRGSIATGSTVFYKMHEPVEPSIFETLLPGMNDPTVVRYIPGTKDISAATPARIVAEISSESFMDYELVSDFFLTFRSYLSPKDLLSLLLARLQWAINRLQDDGRIIRIRTFAALRHWILNYFADDFVPNYDLRVQFCDAINAMYDDVKAREGSGVSDLKILIDLKRCWHGRCSVYWDTLNMPSYIESDYIIVPGAAPVSQAHVDDLDGTCQDIVVQTDFPTGTGVGPPSTSGGVGAQRFAGHFRKGSSATARSIPISTDSDQSVPVTSCSLPPRSPKHWSGSNGSRAPHLVPLVPVKFNSAPQNRSGSPIMSRRPPVYNHAHKRSGSFSDSVRDDRAPQDQQIMPSVLEIPGPGSLIRGDLYPPVESYMTLMAPPSPSIPSDTATWDRRRPSDESSKPASSSSLGVKTIIGSIRRALQSRNGGHAPDERSASQMTSRPSGRGKTSALPANLVFGSRLYRDKKATTMPRKALRIDILCDQVLKQYRLAIGDQDGDDASPNTATDARFQTNIREPESNNIGRASQIPGSRRRRIYSQLTMGSESIVIVNGTGMHIPLMSGAGPGPQHEANSSRVISLRAPSQISTSTGDDRTSFPVYYDPTGSKLAVPSPPSQHFDSVAQRRSYSVGRRSTFRKSTSLRLRKYASFQSGMSKQRHTMQSGVAPSVTDINACQEESEQPSSQKLRRRPGGDLRRMRDIRSIVSDGSHRSSVTDITQNGRSSMSVAGVAPSPPRFSLIETHSSQNMRPSFEAAIAQFAQIPDDDDGGIESTLLKLEGKWRRPSGGDDAGNGATGNESAHHDINGNETWREEQPSLDNRHSLYDRNTRASWDGRSLRRETALDGNVGYSQVGGRLAPPMPYAASVAGSEDSYGSIPLLERGLSDESMKGPNFSQLISNGGAPRPQLSSITSRGTSGVGSSHQSFDVVKETESLKRIPRGSTLPVFAPKPPRDVEDHFSGWSSDFSVDAADASEVVEGGQSATHPSVSELNYEIPPHPLAHPPTPPMTIQYPGGSTTSRVTPLNPAAVFQAPLLTPDPSPQYKNLERGDNERSMDIQQVSGDVLMRSESDCGQQQQQYPQNTSDIDHIPFILACESHILAQQLTLVEMAALSEVDWMDLVDMKWSSEQPGTLNWVQFLSEGRRRGIDLVVGRFNLMVKWVLSEIVLTENMEERARTISKFIHTAVHAKNISNYATMLQICIALSSTDCSRLLRTWALVSPEDKRLFRNMESLIQPVRNFHDLRVEMETANLQEGCIPFVGRFPFPFPLFLFYFFSANIISISLTNAIGLYVHDLTYNAQKPAQIASTRDTEPLVNFERYRRAARIVKNLLRLIDASTEYNFEPVPGIVERCLWIASLPEAEIQARSRKLE